jgi:hypothetical protein
MFKVIFKCGLMGLRPRETADGKKKNSEVPMILD